MIGAIVGKWPANWFVVQASRLHVQPGRLHHKQLLTPTPEIQMPADQSFSPLPQRSLGRTGHNATIFGLGGEGVLRTHGRAKDAVPLIRHTPPHGLSHC